MSVLTNDTLTAFGEAILLINRDRQISAALGATASLLTHTTDELIGLNWLQLLQLQADSHCVAALYWAIEAAFEQYVQPQFLPTKLPFSNEIVAQLAFVESGYVAVQLRPSIIPKMDGLLYKDLYSSLASAKGFTDVMLKHIGGLLTDIQEADLQVISKNAQFAKDLLADWHSEFIYPYLKGPEPIRAELLLQLDMDELPKRKLQNHGLEVKYSPFPDVVVYSNGSIRKALIDLIASLPQYVMQHSYIGITAQIAGEVLEVRFTYRASQNSMKAAQPLYPVDIFERKTIKHSNRLKSVLASLHAKLSPYGSSVWALATASLSLATIVMTVPIWTGPVDDNALTELR